MKWILVAYLEKLCWMLMVFRRERESEWGELAGCYIKVTFALFQIC